MAGRFRGPLIVVSLLLVGGLALLALVPVAYRKFQARKTGRPDHGG